MPARASRQLTTRSYVLANPQPSSSWRGCQASPGCRQIGGSVSILSVAHMMIDAGKIWVKRRYNAALKWFALDQVLHRLTLLIVFSLWSSLHLDQKLGPFCVSSELLLQGSAILISYGACPCSQVNHTLQGIRGEGFRRGLPSRHRDQLHRGRPAWVSTAEGPVKRPRLGRAQPEKSARRSASGMLDFESSSMPRSSPRVFVGLELQAIAPRSGACLARRMLAGRWSSRPGFRRRARRLRAGFCRRPGRCRRRARRS